MRTDTGLELITRITITILIMMTIIIADPLNTQAKSSLKLKALMRTEEEILTEINTMIFKLSKKFTYT